MLHEKIKQKAITGYLNLATLKPNSREVARRMIADGKLLKTERGYIWHEKYQKSV